MASAASAKYAHDGEPGENDNPLKVAEAGRKCVRNLHQYPVLSVEWIALVDSLKQLARLVRIEGRMPANTKVAEYKGRDTSSEGTLWDQESHENAIRILVEEAKVNLCLRMMNDYKKWQYDAGLKEQTMQHALQVFSAEGKQMSIPQLENKCLEFEEFLGLLLNKAFTHVETLQLMDIPLLIEHCTLVLANVQARTVVGGTKTQETVCLMYFSSLMKHAEALNNGELLAKTREVELVHLAVQVGLMNKDQFPPEVVPELLLGFAALASNEDFDTNWEDFFSDPATNLGSGADKKANFMMLDEHMVQPYLAANADQKKFIRPLLDLFNKLKRTM